jgi:uncharacterized membrane protein YkvA (DUF1232 family)
VTADVSVPAWGWIGLAVVALYAAFVLALLAAGRRRQARALAGFLPDCVVLCRRLLADPRVGRRHKVALVLLVAYLLMPLDLVPDFIPVAGQLDDAILIAVVLRAIVRGAGTAIVAEHWPGPHASLRVISKLAPASGSGRG